MAIDIKSDDGTSVSPWIHIKLSAKGAAQTEGERCPLNHAHPQVSISKHIERAMAMYLHAQATNTARRCSKPFSSKTSELFWRSFQLHTWDGCWMCMLVGMMISTFLQPKIV